MKVLGIVCSARIGGNTQVLMEQALAGARSYGAETELWSTAGKNLHGCDGDLACLEAGICKINDDMQELYPKVREADGIIFGSPIYWSSCTSQAKMVIDRFWLLVIQQALVGKVAGIIAVGGSYGMLGVKQEFLDIITPSHMIFADQCWGLAFDAGDVREDKFGMKASEELGKLVASLCKELIECKFQWPKEFMRSIYSHCRAVYGIDSFPRPSKVIAEAERRKRPKA